MNLTTNYVRSVDGETQILSVLHNFSHFEVNIAKYLKRFSFSSYINYSNIAARVLRGALKADLQADATKRAASNIKFTKWTEGKPASEYKAIDNFYLVLVMGLQYM